jgi:D-xylonolactonase
MKLPYTIISDEPYRCGECPMWDHKEKLFYWSDMLAGKLFCYNPAAKEITTVAEGKNVSGFTMNEGGGFVCATHQGLYLWNRREGWVLLADECEGQPLHSNDAAADVKGRFLFGTTFYDQNVKDAYTRGRLYSAAQDGSITILDEGFHLPNGIGFSPNQKQMYVTETVTREIYRYDYDVETGKAANKKVCVKIPDTDGIPDGLTVDAEGYIWSAHWYGSCVVRYDPDGKEERRIDVPSGQTSSVMFAGDNLSDMYVTSAAEVVRLSAAPKGYDFDAPHNGRLYLFHLDDIQGVKEHFANVFH